MVSIQELLSRPIIRTDSSEEWQNKMTDEERKQWDSETYELCLTEGTPKKFPDINAAYLSKFIDQTILYKLFQLHTPFNNIKRIPRKLKKKLKKNENNI